MNTRKLAALLFGALLVGGCTNTKELAHAPGGTVAATIFWGSETAQVVQIGSPDNPFKGKPVIRIKVDGEVLFDSSLSSSPGVLEDLLAKYPSRDAATHRGLGGHPAARSLRAKRSWGAGARCVDLLKPATRKAEGLVYGEARRQSVSIIVREGEVLAIHIADLRGKTDEHSIQLRVGSSEWTNSRMSREECVALLGKAVEELSYFTE